MPLDPMPRPLAPILALTLVLAGSAAARQQRDAPQPQQESAGKVYGRVLAADSSRPVSEAVITAAREDDPPGRMTGSVVADEQGRFSFEALPAGTYEFAASKAGLFLETQYGQTDADLPGTAVLVRAGQDTELELRLLPAGVLSGRVLDVNGDPVALADVALVGRDTNVRGARGWLRSMTTRVIGQGQVSRVSTTLPSSASRTESNDLGEFRFFGLPPDEYLLMATPPTSGSAARTPALVYYPGVSDPSQAGRLTIGPGQQLTAAEFVVRYVPIVPITGIVVGPDGSPVSSGTLSLLAAGLEGVAAVAQLGTFKDGAFRLEAAPGNYVLRAKHPRMRDDSPYQDDLSGSARLVVGDGGLEGITVGLGYGATVHGEIVLEGSARSRQAEFRVLVESGTLGEVRTAVVGRPAEPSASVILGGDGSAAPSGASRSADFSVTGIESGSRRIIPQGPSDLILKGIFVGGEDVTDAPIEIAEGAPISNVRVVFTDAKAPLIATVSPTPPQGGTVVVFPERQDWWTKTSRVKTARIGAAPSTLETLPAGQYLVAALADVSARSLRLTPRLLARLAASAVRVETVEGHNTAVTVQPVRLSR